jgi:hypothetical protein
MTEAKLMREFWIALSVILVIAAGVLFFYLKSRNKYTGPKVKGQKFATPNIKRKAKGKQPPRLDSNTLQTQLLETDNEIVELQGLLDQNLNDNFKAKFTADLEAKQKQAANIREDLKQAKEQEKEHPEAALLDEKGRPLPPNCVILRSKKFGGIKYEYLKPELIPEGSFEHQTEWLNRRMHWLVSEGFDANKQEKFKPFEVPDEIEEYPAKLLDTIKAEPIKEFLKLEKGMLEKVAVWACVAVILGCMFIGFVTITQPKQVKTGTGQLNTPTQPVLTPITLTTTTATTTTNAGGK